MPWNTLPQMVVLPGNLIPHQMIPAISISEMFEFVKGKIIDIE